MARFDIYALPGADGYLVDCQADLFRDLKTRFVVPLLPDDSTPKPLPRLTPVITVKERPYVLATQLAASISVRELGKVVGSVESHDAKILAAIDMLISGY